MSNCSLRVSAAHKTHFKVKVQLFHRETHQLNSVSFGQPQKPSRPGEARWVPRRKSTGAGTTADTCETNQTNQLRPIKCGAVIVPRRLRCRQPQFSRRRRWMGRDWGRNTILSYSNASTVTHTRLTWHNWRITELQCYFFVLMRFEADI